MNKTRTVLHVTDSTAMGGAEQQIVTTLAHLDRDRWKLTLVHPEGVGIAPMVAEVKRLGVTDITVPDMADGLRGAPGSIALAVELRRLRPDIVHLHSRWPTAMKWPLLATALARSPTVVVTVHATMPQWVSRSAILQHRRLASGVDHFIAVSQAVVDTSAETCGWPLDRVCVIHNGIDTEAVRAGDRAACRSALGLGEAEPIVLTLARLDPMKGLDVLIDAAAKVPDAVFLIAGEGPERGALERQVAQLGLGDRVRLLGWRSDCADLMAACDLYVLPSRFEALGVSRLEAMAAGRAVITTDLPSSHELIKDDSTGVLVPVDDPDALADAIRELLADRARCRRLGHAARSHIERNFTVQSMVREIEMIYDEQIEARR